AFYQFRPAPISFNEMQLQKVEDPVYASKLQALQTEFEQVNQQKQTVTLDFVRQRQQRDRNPENPVLQATQQQVSELQAKSDRLREEAKVIIKKADPAADTNDTNYIFLNFVIHYLPRGLIGLLFAIIFLAAWGSIAAALN